MPLPSHLPHIIYATALVSLTLHLHAKKKDVADKRLLANARIGVLEGLVSRLQSGEDVCDEEISRLKRLAAERKEEIPKPVGENEIGWREVIFGKRVNLKKEETHQTESM